MYLRTLLIVIVLGVIAVFAYLNWHVVVLPASLSLGFATVEAPLGVILLAVTATLTLLFLIYLVYLQSAALIESRRYARELQSQREIADNTEASRLKELRGFLELELSSETTHLQRPRTVILARLDELDRDLRATIEQAANSLAASIGEFEDRFERSSGGKN